MHSDHFRFKHYSLSCEQLTMLIPWNARLMHTYHNVHEGDDGFSAVVFEPWGRILKVEDYKAVLLSAPANIIASKRRRPPMLFDQPWHRCCYPLHAGKNVFTISVAAVVADVICGHLVVDEPDCDLPSVEREFVLMGHGAYVDEKQFDRLQYVGCWTGNNGAKVLLEIFEVRPGA